MAAQLSPEATHVLEQLETAKGAHQRPIPNFSVAAELIRAGYAIEASHGGLEITDHGRTFLIRRRAGNA